MEDAVSVVSLGDNLRSAASVASFRSNPIGSFRRLLKECLQSVVSAEKSQSEDVMVISRDHFISTCKNLPWKELCHFHDQVESSRCSNLSAAAGIGGNDEGLSTTPLQEVISQLMDPTIIPRAYVSSVIRVVLEALFESPRRATGTANRNDSTTATRWTYSQLFLLQSVVSLWNVCPTLNRSFSVDSLLDDSSHCTPHKWNRLLSVISYVAGDCPIAYATMLSFLLMILARVDRMEIAFESTDSSEPAKDASSCPCCQATTMNGNSEAFEMPARRRRKGVRMASLDDLHDRDISTTDYRPRHLPRPFLPKGGLSLKDVLSAKGQAKPTGTTTRCHCVIKSLQTIHSTSKLNHEWDVVRARAYRKFQSLFQGPAFWQRTLNQNSCRFDLYRLLQIAHDHYRSPSIRLCLLLTAYHVTSSIHCQRVCQMAWTKFLTTKDPLWLRIYTEIIVDWSCFDEREACWKGFQPFVEYVLGVFHGSNGDSFLDRDPDDDWSTDVNSPAPLSSEVFQSLSQILSRRGCLLDLQCDEIKNRFQSFVKTMEVHCGEVNLWFNAHQRQTLDDRNEAFRMLQRLGILGLTSSMGFAAGEEGSNDICEPPMEAVDEALQSWPFSKPFCLRSAHGRAGKAGKDKFDDWGMLLTSVDFDRLLEVRCSLTHRSRTAGSPLTDHIDNPDLLQQIFHYCDFQDIGKCRQVCQSWKTMIDSSNSLWQDVYRSSFELHPDDPKAQGPALGSEQEDWSRLVMQKVVMERSLMHRRNEGTGWKHRTCAYVGCYHVLKSERLAALHYASHARQAATAVRKKRDKSFTKKRTAEGTKKKASDGKRRRKNATIRTSAKPQPTPSKDKV